MKRVPVTSPNWKDVSDITGTAVVKWDAAHLRGCDPYLVWADASTVMEKPQASEFPHIAVLVELLLATDYADFWLRMNAKVSDARQLRFFPNGFEPPLRAGTRFITGLVSRAGLKMLIEDVVAARIVRFTLQAARRDIAEAQLFNWPGNFLPLAKLDLPTAPEGLDKVPNGLTAHPVFLGLIDDGLPFLKLRDEIEHKVHFWHQGLLPPGDGSAHFPADNPYWQGAWSWFGLGFPASWRGFLYGGRLRSPPQEPKPTSDRTEYFATRYFAPAPSETHGAGVLGLLAPWSSSRTRPVQWPAHIAGLALVQLPSATVNDTSGGSLAMRVLDGLRFVLWQEGTHRAAGDPTPRPVVLNVSYGVHAGPHDGTSMFEAAAHEALELNPHLHLVLPAGNGHLARCHSSHRLKRAGSSGDRATFRCKVLPDNSRDSFIEIWLPERAEVILRVRPPGHVHDLVLRKDEAKVYLQPDLDDSKNPQVQFAAVYPSAVAQGLRGSMILLAIGPTRQVSLRRQAGLGFLGLNQQPRRRVQAPHGIWTVEAINLGRRAITINAWIERGDAAPDQAQGDRQAIFPDSCVESVRTKNADPESTLNGIASFTHQRLHVVGAMRNNNGILSDYSAAGPGRPKSLRSEGPDAVVAGDRSKNLPGLQTSGFVNGVISHISGTSAACAVYSRALAEGLAKCPPSLPMGACPSDAPPEVSCVAEQSPRAPEFRRGQSRRLDLPV